MLRYYTLLLHALIACSCAAARASAEEPTRGASEPLSTGPETEKRFPPLVVPPGFKATLFACDPLIEYPSAIAIGPKEKPGSAFVAIDYMTGLGTEIVRRDEIRLVEDTDGDGYADKATVYATGFNSIEGLTFHAGTVYAMHAPHLTSLRDTDGDGVADERRDLLTGLGLAPEENPVRLHCANGLVMGHDGWLYLALGDHGCDVPRPEGDRLVHHGGAILRCRPDGRAAHVFSAGLRNIYDVALDDELNVFVRDNENDGGDYKLRLCYSFYGADHGYPYLYYERPDEALPPLADLGLGSSAGGAAYLEPQFPAEYRGSLFFCEWGRAVVWSHPARSGAGFVPLKETQFAAGADSDPYGFKPTDLIVERDGSLLVADWCDGQRPKRGRGRIYRVRYVDQTLAAKAPNRPADLLAQLDADSYLQRLEAQDVLLARGADGLKQVEQALAESGRLKTHGRMHAVWILARAGGDAARDKLLELARSDAESHVRVQAIRALADLLDDTNSTRQRGTPGPAFSPETAERLADLGKNADARVRLEVVVALGRLRWTGTAQWLAEHLGSSDPFTAHAAQQSLRRVANWPEVMKLLDLPDAAPLRSIALRAIADQAVPEVADGLISRLADAKLPGNRRAEYADSLARIWKQPGPWVYWGYRPPPRPANASTWERTAAIEEALARVLSDPDRSQRLTLLRRMQREGIPARLEVLAAWLADERDPGSVALIVESLRGHPSEKTRDILLRTAADRQQNAANRALALELMSSGPIVAEAGEAVARLLADEESAVRAAAATAAGRLKLRMAADSLLKRAEADQEVQVRLASLDALRRLGDTRAVSLAAAALADRAIQLTALECLAELGGPEESPAVLELARRDPTDATVALAIAALSKWHDSPVLSVAERMTLSRAVLDLQGQSGLLVQWRVSGPLEAAEATALREKLQDAKIASADAAWRTSLAKGVEASIAFVDKEPGIWLARSDVTVAEATPIQGLASASGKYQVWLNGQQVYERTEPRSFQPDADRFEAALVPGVNRLVIQVAATEPAAQFHLRFRRKTLAAELEKLAQAALAKKGDAARGRLVFLDAKAQCSKCHRVGDVGERIGPELTGLGSRFSRIHIVESILEPSRTVTPGFQAISVRLVDGRVLTGVRVAETAAALTLADQQGQKHVVPKAEIDIQQPQAKSLMPDNLVQQLTAEQFIDLVAFLQAGGSQPPQPGAK